MIPEAELIRSEFTLRDLSLPDSIFLTRRSMLRWLTLSMGLITPEESRDTFFSVVDALFYYLFHLQVSPTTKDIQQYLSSHSTTSKLTVSTSRASHNTGIKGSLLNKGISEKLIRYHLNRLIEWGILERRKGVYSFVVPEDANPDDFNKLFSQIIVKRSERIASNLAKVLSRLKQTYA